MLVIRQLLTPRLLVMALVAFGVARIVSTYHIFNQTWDEPAHIAAGMQWLDRGQYTYEPLHPPLARALTAAGPRLAGIRSAGHESVWLEGNSILYAGGTYDRNLALARLGVLPFFILATLIVFAWARDLYGGAGGAWAALLFTTLPPVLGHAGIATTDIAVTGTVVLAAYWLGRWLERPTRRSSLALGVAVGLAILSKLSALLFLPAVGIAVVLCRRGGFAAVAGQARPPDRARLLRYTYTAVLLTVWAGYRFDVGPLTVPDARAVRGAPLGESPLDRVARAEVFPAPALFEGLGQLAAKNRAGHKSYLLGEVRSTGWSYFFPVALAVKTPLPFLLLTAAGLAVIWGGSAGAERRRQLEPAAIALAILAVCLPSRINIGLRHVLPMYPFLAVVAVGGVAGLWRARRQPTMRLVAIVLVGWQVATSAAAHPDYLAFFNALAGKHPERILVDSDLDDGQDLKRLADTLRARRIPDLWLAYAGSATVAEHGLPPVRWLEPRRRVTGWVAASIYAIKLGSLGSPSHDDFAWLEQHEPVALVGRSIRLYFIP